MAKKSEFVSYDAQVADIEKEDTKDVSDKKHDIINCLRNERIIVRFIPRQTGLVSDPKHVLYGGMSEDATRKFCVPKLSSGAFVNVLTNAEKDCLEKTLGLEPNALSIHKKVNNFWEDGNDNGISQVILKKTDNYLDLRIPEDYIRYKILLANKNIICSSLKELQDHPKATYQFVIINEGDEVKAAKLKMTNTQRCYKEYGKIEDNYDKLRVIVETLSGRSVIPTTKLEFLQTQINNYIQADSRLFLSIISDEYLDFKVIIRKALDKGLIMSKNHQLYYKEDNTLLCEDNEDATLSNAARYLSSPKHQDLLYSIQAKLQ